MKRIRESFLVERKAKTRTTALLKSLLAIIPRSKEIKERAENGGVFSRYFLDRWETAMNSGALRPEVKRDLFALFHLLPGSRNLFAGLLNCGRPGNATMATTASRVERYQVEVAQQIGIALVRAADAELDGLQKKVDSGAEDLAVPFVMSAPFADWYLMGQRMREILIATGYSVCTALLANGEGLHVVDTFIRTFRASGILDPMGLKPMHALEFKTFADKWCGMEKEFVMHRLALRAFEMAGEPH